MKLARKGVDQLEIICLCSWGIQIRLAIGQLARSSEIHI